MKKSRYLQPDGTEKLSNTPRQEGTFLYFTGAGDDVVNGIVGGGEHLIIDNTVEPSVSKSVTVQFLDDIYLKDGTAFWENAEIGDSIDVEVFLPANTAMPVDTKTGNADFVNGKINYITVSQTPDATWVGNYILMPFNYVVNRFVNNLLLLGTNTTGLVLESADAVLIPNIFKMKVTYTNFRGIINPNISCAVMIECYRERTV